MTRSIESRGRARVFRRDGQANKVCVDPCPRNNSFTVAARLLLLAVYVTLTLVGAAQLAYAVTRPQPGASRTTDGAGGPEAHHSVTKLHGHAPIPSRE